MSDLKLYFKRKDYDILYQKNRKELQASEDHPLAKGWGTKKNKGLKPSRPVATSQIMSNDPLSRLGRKVDIKPVQQSVQNQSARKQTSVDEYKKKQGSPWMLIREDFIKHFDVRKQNIQAPVSNPFGGSGLRKQDQIKNASKLVKSVNKTQASNPSQIEIKTYLAMLEDNKKELKAKWDAEDKVTCLQLTIQATKLLHDTEKAKFHALKFAYVIDIVQEFGIYVYDRIKTLSFPGLSTQKIKQIAMHQVLTHNIPDSAQTVCRNWLLKIGAIRELVPRLIIEATLIRLYFFIDNGKRVKHILYRLARSNKCFGQYINSIFFSTFLIRIGAEILPKEKEYIINILEDVFGYIKLGKNRFCHPDVSNDEFFNILEAFFKTSFQSLGQNLDESDFKRLAKSLPPNPHPIIIKSLIGSFNLRLVGMCCVDLMKMIQRVPKDERYSLYAVFLRKLSASQFQNSKELVQELWSYFEGIEDLSIFLQILAPFVQLIFANIKGASKTLYLNNIFDKFSVILTTNVSQNKHVYDKFQEFLSTLLQNTSVTQILTLEPFLQMITYFPKLIKQKISRSVASIFVGREEQKIQDQMVVNAILGLLKNIMLQKETVGLVLRLVSKVDFGNDLDSQLNFYAEVRTSFGYISEITIDLINKTVLLTIKIKRLAKGRMTTKVRSFLQACIAYCYITIPLIDAHLKKTQLYLYLSEVALSYNLISQSNDLLKMAIKSVTQYKGEATDQVYVLVKQIMGFLIVTPDDPETDYLFLYNGVANALEQIKFTAAQRMLVYSDCLTYLSTQVQDRLPVHIQGVYSNDFLFKMKEFREVVMERLGQTFTKLETELHSLASSNDTVEKKVRSVLMTTMTILSVMQISPRLQKYLEDSGDVIQQLLGSQRDKKTSASFKPLLKAVNQSLLEGEYQVMWAFAQKI